MSADWSADLAIAPQGARDRITAGINKRGRRAFGVLKIANEYIGVVGPREFEIWERQNRAVHARGRIAPIARGTRVEVDFVTPGRTRVLLVLFFVLYLFAALGVATQPPDAAVSPGEVAIAAAGALVLAGLFMLGARSQRADLRTFLDRTFADVRRI